MPIYDPIAKALGVSPINFSFDLKTDIPEDAVRDSYAGELNGMYGLRHTDESKAIMSLKKKGVKLSEEHRRNIGKALKGKKMPWLDEHRIRMNKEAPRMLGKKQSEETRKKIKEAHLGKVKTLEHCRKISESKKGKKLSDEVRARIAAGHRGLKQSPETIAKRIATTKARREAKEKASYLDGSLHTD